MNKLKDKTPLELKVEKLEADLKTTSKLATTAIKNNIMLTKEVQRLITRINTNESNIGHLSSKR